MTLAIAVVLGGLGAYAFAGAGLIRRLPLMRTALVAITADLSRCAALALVPALTVPTLARDVQHLVVADRAGVSGLSTLVGTWRAWPHAFTRNDA